MKQNIKFKQQGVALFVSLMFLIIITVLSLSAMNTSIMEQRMSANSQYSMEALQYAQTIQDYFYANAKAANLLEVNDISTPRSICFGKANKYADPDVACDATFPANFFDNLQNNINTENLAGLYSAEIVEYPETYSQSKTTDLLKPYEFIVTYNNTANGFGQATVVLGFSGPKAIEGSSIDTGNVDAEGNTIQP